MGIRVAIQERARFFREGLELVLAGEPDIEVIGAVVTGPELSELCAAARPDVVLLEIEAEGWDPSRVVAGLRRRSRWLRVVGVCGDADPVTAMRAQQLGVRSIVSRHAGVAGIVAAVRQVPRGHTVTPMPARRTEQPRTATLTARELDVLRLVGAGNTTREISAELGISPKTVENHKQRMFAKLGVQNQAHAIAVAMRAGLVAPGVALRG